MARIVVDPITRIEGHLRIESELNNGALGATYSSSTMFRGLEIIFNGREPRSVHLLAQRI